MMLITLVSGSDGRANGMSEKTKAGGALSAAQKTRKHGNFS
jgi:hypothetical protein